MQVDVVIVNWNAGIQLFKCVDSVIKYGQAIVDKIIVVDNGSTDASEDAIEGLPNVTLIRAGSNLGFGKACNLGAKFANNEFLLFLNPDTILFENSLSASIAFMQRAENSKIGICGIRLIDENGKYSTSGAHFPSIKLFFGSATGFSRLFPKIFPTHLLTANESETSGLVDQVIGAYFLVRKFVYDKLGGFDERFFVYFEEVDFALRARDIGFNSYLLCDVSAYHKGGGCTDSVKAMRLFYSLRSRLQYGKKHFTLINNIALFIITVFIEFNTRIALAIYRRSLSQVIETIEGYKKLFKYWIDWLKNGV